MENRIIVNGADNRHNIRGNGKSQKKCVGKNNTCDKWPRAGSDMCHGCQNNTDRDIHKNRQEGEIYMCPDGIRRKVINGNPKKMCIAPDCPKTIKVRGRCGEHKDYVA
jgi:hypothetical protein